MKKYILALLAFFTFSLSAFAADFTLDQLTQFKQNTIASFSTIRISAQTNGEITAEHGLAIRLAEQDRVLWQAPQTLTLSGSAVEAGRMEASVVPTFSADMKILYLPVLKDFTAAEEVIINGLQVRTYNKTVTQGFLELDLNGDSIAEKTLFNSLKIESADHSDSVAPFAVSQLSATPHFDQGTLTLNWVNPPDYDFVQTIVQKAEVVDGQAQDFIFAFQAFSGTEFVDEGLKEGDQIAYRVYAYDQGNASEAAEVMVDFTPVVVEPTPTEPTPTEPQPPVEEPTTPTEPTPETPDLTGTGYKDVTTTDWFFDAVVYGEKVGKYFDVTEKFNPEASSDRAQYAKLLAAFTGSETDFVLPSTPSFTDVPLAHWAALPIYSLAKTGALTGYKTLSGELTDTFGLADQITREQAVAGLVRALQVPTELTGGSPFTDVTPADWSYELIVTAHNAGLVEGQTTSFFNKNTPLNRAELAQLFYNAALWIAAEKPL